MREVFSAALGRMISTLREVASGLWIAEARFRGVQVSEGVVFQGRPILSVAPNSKMVIGPGVTVASSRRSNPLGNAQECVLRTLEAGAELSLGERVGISGAVICAAKRIVVGDGTIVGAGALIIDNDFHSPEGEFDWGGIAPGSARPVSIGRGCFIGARSIILKGVTIGDRAVVGAGAVVSVNIPAGALAVGNPAVVKLKKSTSSASPVG